MLTTAKAIELVEPLYEDRRDKLGYPEWSHIEAVMDGVSKHARPMAVLHDSVEDELLTFRQIYPLMEPVQFETLLLITRDGTLTYMNYIRMLAAERDRGNPAGVYAAEIKQADLRHNMTRKTPSNMQGMREPGGRYWKAWTALTGREPDFLLD